MLIGASAWNASGENELSTSLESRFGGLCRQVPRLANLRLQFTRFFRVDTSMGPLRNVDATLRLDSSAKPHLSLCEYIILTIEEGIGEDLAGPAEETLGL
jgi:hypothetical protein